MQENSTIRYPLFAVLAVLLLFFSLPAPIAAQTHSGRYDISYIWDPDLAGLLEYKEEVEKILGPEVAARLRFVKRDALYGLIYDRDGSSESADRVAEIHSELLVKRGFEKAEVIRDVGYHELYNVSYGLGPNLDALKKQYARLYRYLGQEFGKDLFIEQTKYNQYSLIYRRRGDRKSTATVASRHSRLLKKIGLSASITLENNNEVVFGESSLLDSDDASVTARKEEVKPARPLAVIKETPEPPPVAAKTKIAIKAEVFKKRPEKSGPSTAQADAQADAQALAQAATQAEAQAAAQAAATRAEAQAAATRAEAQAARISPALDSEMEDLEAALEDYIKGLRRQGRIAKDESTAWLVYDFTSGKKLVDINENISFQAASMIKPLVALAFFHKVKEGKLMYGPKSRRQMERMIQRSSNSATNWVMRHAGGPAEVQRIIKTYYGDLCRNTSIVEYIPTNGQTYRNMASPEDYNLFLDALWRGQLPNAKEIRRLMALPGQDRLYHGTKVPRGTLVYNKTGSTAHLCGDMGILAPRGTDGRRYPYTIVGIIEKKSRAQNYGRWMMARGNVIRQVSNMVYDDMKQRYQLR